MADYTDVLFEDLVLELSDFDDPAIVVFFPATTQAPDTVAPVIDLVSPLTSAILPGTAIVLDVTDETALRDTIIYVAMGSAREVIWGGELESFSPGYSSGSMRSSIAGGYRYTLHRRGGWFTSPTFHALAFDQGGNQT